MNSEEWMAKAGECDDEALKTACYVMAKIMEIEPEEWDGAVKPWHTGMYGTTAYNADGTRLDLNDHAAHIVACVNIVSAAQECEVRNGDIHGA